MEETDWSVLDQLIARAVETDDDEDWDKVMEFEVDVIRQGLDPRGE